MYWKFSNGKNPSFPFLRFHISYCQLSPVTHAHARRALKAIECQSKVFHSPHTHVRSHSHTHTHARPNSYSCAHSRSQRCTRSDLRSHQRYPCYFLHFFLFPFTFCVHVCVCVFPFCRPPFFLSIYYNIFLVLVRWLLSFIVLLSVDFSALRFATPAHTHAYIKIRLSQMFALTSSRAYHPSCKALNAHTHIAIYTCIYVYKYIHVVTAS